MKILAAILACASFSGVTMAKDYTLSIPRTSMKVTLSVKNGVARVKNYTKEYTTEAEVMIYRTVMAPEKVDRKYCKGIKTMAKLSQHALTRGRLEQSYRRLVRKDTGVRLTFAVLPMGNNGKFIKHLMDELKKRGDPVNNIYVDFDYKILSFTPTLTFKDSAISHMLGTESLRLQNSLNSLGFYNTITITEMDLVCDLHSGDASLNFRFITEETEAGAAQNGTNQLYLKTYERIKQEKYPPTDSVYQNAFLSGFYTAKALQAENAKIHASDSLTFLEKIIDKTTFLPIHYDEHEIKEIFPVRKPETVRHEHSATVGFGDDFD